MTFFPAGYAARHRTPHRALARLPICANTRIAARGGGRANGMRTGANGMRTSIEAGILRLPGPPRARPGVPGQHSAAPAACPQTLRQTLRKDLLKKQAAVTSR